MCHLLFHTLEKIERWLRVAVIVIFTCVIVMQTFIAQEQDHFYWSFADYLNGERLSTEYPLVEAREGTLILAIDERSCQIAPLVIINGYDAASFSSQTVMIRVRNGDLITIDGTDCRNTLTYRVIAVSSGVTWPHTNYSVQTHASSVLLGKVSIDD